MARQPLFKTVSPPLGAEQRLRFVQLARLALAERAQLPPAFRARGLLALHKAEERLQHPRARTPGPSKA